MDDRPLLTRRGDGQLRRPFGTIGELHDLLAKLVIARVRADAGQELLEYICNENNKDVSHILGKEGRDERIR